LARGEGHRSLQPVIGHFLKLFLVASLFNHSNFPHLKKKPYAVLLDWKLDCTISCNH